MCVRERPNTAHKLHAEVHAMKCIKWRNICASESGVNRLLIYNITQLISSEFGKRDSCQLQTHHLSVTVFTKNNAEKWEKLMLSHEFSKIWILLHLSFSFSIENVDNEASLCI